MFSNSLRKIFSRSLRRYALFGARKIIACLPFAFFKILSPCFVKLGWFFFKKKRRIVEENLHAAFFREKSRQEIEAIADKFFRHIFSAMTEFIYFLDRPEKIVEKVAIEGKAYLDEALRLRRGAIMLSAHFGSFGLMFLRLALEGYKSNFIIRPIRDKHIGNFITDYSAQHGIHTIYALPLRQCVEESLKALRNNQLLFVLLDQNHSQDAAVYVDFFGRPAATATGPVVFSARAKAPILPVFITGDIKHGYKVKIERALDFSEEAAESDLESSTVRLTKIIEEQIRLNPHEWGGWMHRRWKSAKDVVKTRPAESASSVPA